MVNITGYYNDERGRIGLIKEAIMAVYHLLYKVGYKGSEVWKYERYKIKASSLAEAKAKARKSHPKATKFTFDHVIK